MYLFKPFLLLLIFAIQSVSYSDVSHIDGQAPKITLPEERVEKGNTENLETQNTFQNQDLKGPIFPPEEFIPVPDPKERSQFITEFISTMGTLGLIISLILIFGWFLKRLVNNKMIEGNDSSEIQIVERRMISPKTAIYAIEVKGKGVILAETANGVIRLADYPAENLSSPLDEEKIPSSFKKILDDTKR